MVGPRTAVAAALMVYASALVARRMYTPIDSGPAKQQATALTEPSTARSSILCAIGDMHGDLDHAYRALRLCGAVDAEGRWNGGHMTVVQVGDVLDRGNRSLELIKSLWALRSEAAVAGGELVLLMGNHELLNLQGKAFYVHPSELEAAGGSKEWRKLMSPVRGEVGAQIAKQHDAMAVRGEHGCRTLFLHAGLRLSDADQYGSIDKLNTAIREQVLVNHGPLLDPRNGPLWFRGYARPRSARLSDETSCSELDATLSALYPAGDVRRMAAGHNIVPWITTRCGGMLHLLDIGMSSAYGGHPAAWTCRLDEQTNAPIIHAHYENQEPGPPPELCTRCSEMSEDEAVGEAGQDCAEYCRV